MRKLYKLIYYKLYVFFMAINKKDTPEGNAMIILSLWICLYFGVGYALIREIGGPKVPKIAAVGIFLLICLINYLLLVNKGRHKIILDEFKGNDKSLKNKGKLIMVVFLSLPFVIFILFSFSIWK